MDKYLNSFREMISLRGLTDHTLNSYCTYIRGGQRGLHDLLVNGHGFLQQAVALGVQLSVDDADGGRQ